MKLAHGLAFGRSLWTRHRGDLRPLAVTALMFAAVGGVGLLAFGHWQWAVFAGVAPLTIITVFLMNALLNSDEPGSLASGYLHGSFTLPVPTGELVAWPMISGSVIMIVCGIAIGLVASGASDGRIPFLATALGPAVVLSWFQAITWSPFAVPWLRPVLSCALIPAGYLVGIWLFLLGPPATSSAILFFAGNLIAAYTLASLALRSARRGDRWRLWPRVAWLARPGKVGRTPRPFRSPAAALAWFDWRCYGVNMPVIIALINLAMIIPVFAVSRWPLTSFVLKILLPAPFVAPALCAQFLGADAGRMAPFWIKSSRSVAFAALRPLTSWQIVRSKFRTSALSVLLFDAIILVTLASCIALTGSLDLTAELWRSFAAIHPGWEAPWIAGLAVVGFPFVLWKLSTDLLPSGLTGRRWIADGSGVLLLAAIIPAVVWLISWSTGKYPAADACARALLPAIITLAAIGKGAAAAWAYRECSVRGLMKPRDEVTLIAWWAVVSIVAVIFSLLLVPSAWGLMPRIFLCVAVASFVPLGRFPLSVLAFEWNRHR